MSSDHDIGRSARQAILRGWKRKCPKCGTGPLMSGYLQVADECSVCGQELHHQRADDGPAFLTILIGGHILAPLMLLVIENYKIQPVVLSSIFGLIYIIMAALLLPRIKGAMIGIQWSKRMHGFGQQPKKQ